MHLIRSMHAIEFVAQMSSLLISRAEKCRRCTMDIGNLNQWLFDRAPWLEGLTKHASDPSHIT